MKKSSTSVITASSTRREKGIYFKPDLAGSYQQPADLSIAVDSSLLDGAE